MPDSHSMFRAQHGRQLALGEQHHSPACALPGVLGRAVGGSGRLSRVSDSLAAAAGTEYAP